MKNKRIIALVLALVSVLMLLASCSPKKDEVLNIFTWEGYFPDEIIAEFEKETGIKVNYNTFDSNENMLTKLQAENGGEYDIILASDYIIEIAIQEGLVAELDKSKIPNYKNINTVYQGRFHDPQDKYTIPYAPGSPMIIYDPAVVDVDIQGYADLLDPKLKDSVIMMNDARVVIGTMLMSLGYSMNSTVADELAAAEARLDELKPNIRALDSDNPQAVLASGEVPVGYIFTSQIAVVLAEREGMKVVYPKEGIGFGVDCIFVPSRAPHSGNADKFINFILDAERGAKISELIGYLCPNEASEEFLSDAYKNNPAFNIPQELLENADEIINLTPDELDMYNEIWLRFKK